MAVARKKEGAKKDERSIHFLDVVSGAELSRFDALEDRWLAQALSPDGKFFAWGGWTVDGNVHVCDVATRKLVHAFAGHRGPIWSLAFAPDGWSLVRGSADGTALMWKLP